jgi:hypothetical protein
MLPHVKLVTNAECLQIDCIAGVMLVSRVSY